LTGYNNRNLKGNIPFRIGIGLDAHQLKKGRQLLLGGVRIPFTLGLDGHSDADVLIHALIDALCGTLGLPDIGTQFPDTDPKYHNADSRELFKTVLAQITRAGYRIAQIDAILVCDLPKLSPYVPEIRKSLARLTKIPDDLIGIKAKTTEGTRLALPQKSITALVTVLLVTQ